MLSLEPVKKYDKILLDVELLKKYNELEDLEKECMEAQYNEKENFYLAMSDYDMENLEYLRRYYNNNKIHDEIIEKIILQNKSKSPSDAELIEKSIRSKYKKVIPTKELPMQETNITLTNGYVLKKGYVGFSWTTLFFGAFVPLFRGDWLYFLIVLIAQFVTYGLASIIFAFVYNGIYTKNLIEKFNYAPNDEYSKKQLLKFNIIK